MLKRGEIKEVPKSHPRVQKKINKTLNTSVKEGATASISTSIGTSYITPFALAMNATATQVGILGAIAQSLPSISGLISSKLIEKHSRKKIITIGITLQTIMWLLIIGSGIMYLTNESISVWVLIGLAVIYFASMGIIHPAWFSLMGSLVPEQKRGEYFAMRTKIMQIVGIATIVAAAIILDYTKKIGITNNQETVYTFIGFSIIFFIAFIARVISFFLINKHYEPRLKIKKRDHQTIKQFIKELPQTPFGRFTIYKSALLFTIYIGTPFYVVYMLRELQFSYTWYMIITVAGVLSQVIYLKLIGKVSDQFGNILLTKIASLFYGIAPLAWALSYIIPSPLWQKIYLLSISLLVNGLAVGSIVISTQNYIYDTTKKEKVGYVLAHYSLLTGLSVMAGALLGSLIVEFDIFSINIIVMVLIISGLARCTVALIGTRYLQEVKTVKKFTTNEMIHSFHPIRDTVHEFHHINHLGAQTIHFIKKEKTKR